MPAWSAEELALLQKLNAKLLDVPADAEPEVLAARLVLAIVLRESPDVTRLADALSKVAAVLLGDRKLDLDAARESADGGDLELLAVSGEGVVTLRLRGSCTGCGSAAETLRNGIERWIKAKVPGVREVVAAD